MKNTEFISTKNCISTFNLLTFNFVGPLLNPKISWKSLNKLKKKTSNQIQHWQLNGLTRKSVFEFTSLTASLNLRSLGSVVLPPRVVHGVRSEPVREHHPLPVRIELIIVLVSNSSVGPETNSVTSRTRPKLITHVKKRTRRTEGLIMVKTKQANKPRNGIVCFDLLTFRWGWQFLEQKLRGPDPHSSPSFAGVWIPCYHPQVCSPETHSPPQQQNYFSAPKLGIHEALVLDEHISITLHLFRCFIFITTCIVCV